jgi:hypothetical protein
MLKRLFLAVLLLAAAGRAGAVDFTDIWYNPAESVPSGWGVNVVQSDAFIFLTFFIYGADGKPTWFTGQVTQDASGNYNGGLYATTGTYYVSPWAGGSQPVAVGTVSFQPSGPYTAKLIYSVNGVGTVTKLIQRQTLTTIALGGVYSGAQIGTFSGCANNVSYRNFFDLQITHLSNGNVTFAVVYPDIPNYSCTLTGTLQQYGQLYSVPAATFQCTDGTNASAVITELKATAQGVEGRFSASYGGGCGQNAEFSGALN